MAIWNHLANSRGLALLAPMLMAAMALSQLSCSDRPSRAQFNEKGQLVGLRDLTGTEIGRDFDDLSWLFKNYYGPFQYKEKLFKMKIDSVIESLKAKAVTSKNDEEIAGYVMQMGATLHDGHVQISLESTASGIARYRVPILLTPVKNTVLIGDVAKELSEAFHIQAGDEVLAVDDRAPLDYLPIITKYKNIARDLSNRHLIYYLLSRPSYLTDLVPKSKTVRIKTKGADGVVNTFEVPWTTDKYNSDVDNLIKGEANVNLKVPFAEEMNGVTGNIKQMGAVDPFFVNARTQDAFKFIKVYPSDATRKKFGLGEKETPPIYAALYKFGGKTLLLVRQATYSPSDFKTEVYMKAYMALFYEYQDIADAMVLDQTHNPGGSYCADFYNLFARPTDYQGAEYLHADRKWINDLRIKWISNDPKKVGGIENRTLEAWSLLVERAYDQGKSLTEAVPLFTGSFFPEKLDFTWSKPLLVLIDELAGSCGDMFPMLVKANQRAKMFGQNTMGLGGNVEEVGVLTNSRIHISMTRGLFFPYRPDRGPTDAEFIENNGIAPDYEYEHTVEDYRGGFVGYVKAFSEKAVAQIK